MRYEANALCPVPCALNFNIPPAFAKASAGKAGPLQRGNSSKKPCALPCEIAQSLRFNRISQGLHPDTRKAILYIKRHISSINCHYL